MNLTPAGYNLNYKVGNHIHTDEVVSTYTYTGENILGQMVTSKMERVECVGCGDDSVRLAKVQ